MEVRALEAADPGKTNRQSDKHRVPGKGPCAFVLDDIEGIRNVATAIPGRVRGGFPCLMSDGLNTNQRRQCDEQR
jgi:hypothetical protein